MSSGAPPLLELNDSHVVQWKGFHISFSTQWKRWRKRHSNGCFLYQYSQAVLPNWGHPASRVPVVLPVEHWARNQFCKAYTCKHRQPHHLLGPVQKEMWSPLFKNWRGAIRTHRQSFCGQYLDCYGSLLYLLLNLLRKLKCLNMKLSICFTLCNVTFKYRCLNKHFRRSHQNYIVYSLVLILGCLELTKVVVAEWGLGRQTQEG